jgi:hypothetical protein
MVVVEAVMKVFVKHCRNLRSGFSSSKKLPILGVKINFGGKENRSVRVLNADMKVQNIGNRKNNSVIITKIGLMNLRNRLELDMFGHRCSLGYTMTK